MVVLKKLKINIVCGILDIVASFLYFFSLFLIGTFSGAIGASDGTEVLSQVLLIFAILFIVLHFISFRRNKIVHYRKFNHRHSKQNQIQNGCRCHKHNICHAWNG